MSKRTRSRNGREARKRKKRIRRRLSKAWHKINYVCRTGPDPCWQSFRKGEYHTHNNGRTWITVLQPMTFIMQTYTVEDIILKSKP